VWGSVEGRQTVPRAEVMSFLTFLQRTAGLATYVCDATFVVQGVSRIQQGASWRR